MFAVYKREVKAYFYSPIAYVLIGMFIFISSLFFMGNLYGQSADVTSVISAMGTVIMFILPILTMRILAEDRRNGTEVLLITSPTKLTGIVMGKFFAAITVYAVMNVVSFMYPLILSIYGKPPMAAMIGSYIGFFLLGSTFIAIGLFASSLSENQIIAGVVSLVIIISMWIIDYVASYTSGILAKILSWFSLLSRYNDFNRGILNLSHIIYYLSFIAVFVFLTIRVIEKRRWSQG